MDTNLKFPFYLKAALFLVGLYIFISMLYLGQDIILPLIYATILAILISPAVNFLVNKKVNRAISIALVLSVAFVVTGGAIALLASQISHLGNAWPKLIIKFHDITSNTINWVSDSFNIDTQNVKGWIKDIETQLMNNRSAAIGVTLTSVGGILSGAVLTPVYIIMILFYQPHLIAFVHRLFGADNDEKVSDILSHTKTIVQSYILGLFAEFVIIAILNSVGLLALRIDYAILLGVIGAVLNVVPIIGGIICIALFVMVALITKSPIYILYVVGLYTIIQFIDDHYIFPKIVGSRVKLNLLVSVIAVILGDALWGIPGMFLAIPLTAIVKLICDRIEPLKTWGFLLGTAEQNAEKIKFAFTIKGFVQGLNFKKS
jgi:predicted PurR-regulated permease PerM